MSRLRYDLVETDRRRERGTTDEALTLERSRYAARYGDLWLAGGVELAELGVRVREALIEYSGENAFLVSVQQQVRRGGCGWLPSVKQTRAVARSLKLV